MATNGDGTLTFGGNFAFNNANTSESLSYSADLGITYEDVMFTDAANYDFSLQSGSPALTGGVSVPNDDFFTQVNFSGGVGESGTDHDWTSGASWIKWSD